MRNETGRTLTRTLVWVALFCGALGLSLGVSVPPVLATDEDGDGLDAVLEGALGTSDTDSDCDDDSLSDFEEVFELGTDPLLNDSDCDSLTDDQDPDPLDDGCNAGGRTTPDNSLSSNLDRPNLVGTTPTDLVGLNAISGEMQILLGRIDLGPGYRGRNTLDLYYLSGITLNGSWGWNVVTNWDHAAVIDGNSDVTVTMYGRTATYEYPDYDRVDGWPFDLEVDEQEDEILLTAIRGGQTWVFDLDDGWLVEIEDRFGNATTFTRNGSGEITTVTLPEGNQVTLSTYNSGRYHQIQDWNTPARTWTLTYNYYDELAKFSDSMSNTTQFFYTNGVSTPTLSGNLVRVKLPTGDGFLKVEYDGSDRVSKQTIGPDSATISYTSTSTTITDFAGNQRVWSYTAGADVPDSLERYSNRNVRATDPATWTTSFDHDDDGLRTKIVFPKRDSSESDGDRDRLELTWDSDYCLTERRYKHSNTDTDNNEQDLVWTYTYGSTYNQLEDSTDPEGNTTERTLSQLELVTQIDYPDITHPNPDVSITESFTWNGNGQLVTATHGEGAVTRRDYYSTGVKTGLLWKETVDYGTGKLNLVTEYDYSNERCLASREDPDGNVWTFDNDDLNRLTGKISPSPMGYETKWTFNSNGFLTLKEVENVDETNTRDATNPWFATSMTYDVAGRVLTVTEEIDVSNTRTTTLEYDGNGNLTSITYPEGNETVQVFDERDLLASRTRAYGESEQDPSTEEWDYDGQMRLVEFVDGRDKDWERHYDSWGRLDKETTPLGHYVTYDRDRNGNVTQVERYSSRDTLLAARRQTFDEINRMYMREDWLDVNEDGDWTDGGGEDAGEWLATDFDLDDRGLLVAVRDPLDHETEITYDNARRKTCWEDHLGNKIEYDYTNDSLVPTQIDEVELKPTTGTETFVTEQVTDALHRITERTVVNRLDSNDEHTTTWKYDSLSVAVEVEDAEENQTWYTHDALGRITKKEIDLGGGAKITQEWGFDLNDNLSWMKDDSGNQTDYAYNARDLRTEIEYADDETRTFTWNDDDTLAGWTDENGTVVTNTYDDDGRLTARSINRAYGVLGPTSETYGYDGLGRLIQADNSNSEVDIAFDTLSRKVSETQDPNDGGGETISYAYLSDGSRDTCTYFSGYVLDYTSDAVGRWSKIENGSGDDLVTWTYYGPGRRIGTVTYHDGDLDDNTSEALSYNGFRWVSSIDHKTSAPTEFAGFDYGYDKMGNPLYEERSHQSGAGDIYDYDKAYRLKAAVIGSADPSNEIDDDDPYDKDETYSHVLQYNMDYVSNRTSVVSTPYAGGGTTTSYTSNSVNCYTVVGGVNRGHDPNGNLTDDGTLLFSYDYRNNLVLVENGQGTVAEYEFDALGRRTCKTVGQDVTWFFHDGEHAVQEYDDSNNLLRTFVYGQRIDEIRVMLAPDIADVDDDQDTSEVLPFYFHHNMLGSVTHITGPDETVVEQYDYTPYGQTTIRDGNGTDLSGTSAIGNPYMFTARRLDEETGLYHYRRRAYDPVTGRFLQRDPLGYVDGPSVFQYVGGTPTRYQDPLGLYPEGKHFAAVKAIAKAAGYSDEEADVIAEGAYDADSGGTEAGALWQAPNNSDFHAMGGTWDEKCEQYAALWKEAATWPGLKGYYLLGYAMHYLMDMYAHSEVTEFEAYTIGHLARGTGPDDPHGAKYRHALWEVARALILFKRMLDNGTFDQDDIADAGVQAESIVQSIWNDRTETDNRGEGAPANNKYDSTPGAASDGSGRRVAHAVEGS